ncbi:hypothetical protein FGIG_10264 [Fasciola gigantica]|uniref:Voltage-dependent calcium channel alpha-2/delta subunit conserved region domain-containing protein n=1 Tax=Fasciola gigantica TaxID=46835 RepID=A0A504YJ35_FASGI|nr:hypothetical protein FGIG_10264 [Fasciola gigantica]
MVSLSIPVYNRTNGSEFIGLMGTNLPVEHMIAQLPTNKIKKIEEPPNFDFLDLEFNRFGKKNAVRKKLIDNEDGVQKITDFIKVTDGVHTYASSRSYTHTRLPNTDFGLALVTPTEPTAYSSIAHSEQFEVNQVLGAEFAINTVLLQSIFQNSRAVVPEHVLDENRLPVLEVPSSSPVASEEFWRATRDYKDNRWSKTTTTTSTHHYTTKARSGELSALATPDDAVVEIEVNHRIRFGIRFFQSVSKYWVARSSRKSRSVTEMETDCQSAQSENRSIPEYCLTEMEPFKPAIHSTIGPNNDELTNLSTPYPKVSTGVDSEVVPLQTPIALSNEDTYFADGSKNKENEHNSDAPATAAEVYPTLSTENTLMLSTEEEINALPVSSTVTEEDMTNRVIPSVVDNISVESGKSVFQTEPPSTPSVRLINVDNKKVKMPTTITELLTTAWLDVPGIEKSIVEEASPKPVTLTTAAINKTYPEEDKSPFIALVPPTAAENEMDLLADEISPALPSVDSTTNPVAETQSSRITESLINMDKKQHISLTTSAPQEDGPVSVEDGQKPTFTVRRKSKFSQASFKLTSMREQIQTYSPSVLPLRDFLRAARLQQKKNTERVRRILFDVLAAEADLKRDQPEPHSPVRSRTISLVSGLTWTVPSTAVPSVAVTANSYATLANPLTSLLGQDLPTPVQTEAINESVVESESAHFNATESSENKANVTDELTNNSEGNKTEQLIQQEHKKLVSATEEPIGSEMEYLVSTEEPVPAAPAVTVFKSLELDSGSVKYKAGVVGMTLEPDFVQEQLRKIPGCAQDSEKVCYFLDDGGFIVSVNQFEYNDQIGLFLGRADPPLMHALLENDVYDQ